MLTFIELLIGVVVIVGVARYIIKGYSATGVLFVGGLLLLIISAIMGHKVLPSSQASTGYSATDIVEYVKEGANKRGNSSRLTQSFHFFMFEPIFSPVNALNQPI